MTCVRLNKTHAEFQKLDAIIRENVASGFIIRKEQHLMAEEFSYEKLCCTGHINRRKVEGSVMDDYVKNVRIIQRYAEWNRQIIVREILKGMKWKALEQFSVADRM